jgi:O-acetyl-ADP-ribose deacetylase (regulator of RNase III)
MAVKIISGNIFTSDCQTIVNTINCVGVMGAGIALECRLRYPDMYEKYIKLCESKQMDIGLLWIYKSNDKWILNFPTKKDWKYPSKKEYLHAGLKKFVTTYEERGIKSVAFPLLGSDRGGIPKEESQNIMISYLDKLQIDVEIYHYDRTAKDDLYDKTKEWLMSTDTDVISKSIKSSKKVIDAMQNPKIVQLNQLLDFEGIGIKTLESVFNFVRDNSGTPIKQESLF